MTLTAERLRALLDYDPATGVLTWRVNRGNRKAGDAAGYISDGYVRIRVDGTLYPAHCLAVLHVTGEWPSDEVDHVDTVRANNGWINLREATHAENMRNASIRSDSTTGHKGVTRKPNGKYEASIKLDGERIYLGVFTTAHEAADMRNYAARDLHGVYARAE